jgi:hypothetical protein
MPLPEPHTDEGHDEFLSRCHSALADEFEDHDQRNAICEQQWRAKAMGQQAETKSVSVEVKAADEGVVVAKFASMGVKDLDGDVTEPGAFGEQDVRVSAYDHASWMGALPVGTGTIEEKGDAAIATLNFFMNSTHGRDHFETVKGLGSLGEWSYGFDILEKAEPTEEQRELGVVRVLKKLKVHEVSPVFRGAGVGTETLAVKSEDKDTATPSDPDPEPTEEEKKEAALREEVVAEVGKYELLRAEFADL